MVFTITKKVDGMLHQPFLFPCTCGSSGVRSSFLHLAVISQELFESYIRERVL